MALPQMYFPPNNVLIRNLFRVIKTSRHAMCFSRCFYSKQVESAGIIGFTPASVPAPNCLLD
ncbi:MAG TPA: hypothetical protein VMW51_04940, partial [Terriglobia bacterium]|nr:hypothetical protein [Terriglobia bacterium]